MCVWLWVLRLAQVPGQQWCQLRALLDKSVLACKRQQVETVNLAVATAHLWNATATHLPGSHPSCSRAEGAIKASEASQADATTKLQKLDEEVRQLRDALSSAQQRATAAEARVELLQEAVRKAEERAARLEMAAASRAAAGGSGDAAGDGAAAAADGSREAQLAAEVKLLREELAAAQVGAPGWQSGCRVCGMCSAPSVNPH